MLLVNQLVGFGVGGGLPPIQTQNFTLTADGISNANRTGRIILQTGLFGGIDGSQIRVTLEAAAGSACTWSKVYFGKQSSGATAVSLSQVLFSGGASTGSVSAGTTITSDWLSVSFTAADNWIISYYISSGEPRITTAGITNTDWYFKSGADEAATASVSGYTQSTTNAPVSLNKFEWQ